MLSESKLSDVSLPSLVVWVLTGFAVLFACITQSGVIGEIAAHDLNIAIPYLMSEGMPLYQQTGSYHPPLFVWFLAGLHAISPDSLLNIRVLNVIMVLVTSALLFSTGRRIWSTSHGLWAIIFYALWVMAYNSLFFYVDALVGVCALMVVWVASFKREGTPWLSLTLIAVLAGLAGMLKQNGLGVLLGSLAWLVLSHTSFKEGLKQAVYVFVIGLVLYMSQFIILAINGTLDDALFYLFNPGNSNWIGNLTSLLDGHALRSMSLTLIFIPVFLLHWWHLQDRRKETLMIFMMGAGLLLNVPVPGYYHMMAMLPVVALMSGWVIGEALHTASSDTSNLRLTTSGLLIGIGGASLMMALTPLIIVFTGQSRIIGWDELRPISAWLEENSPSDESILVLPAYDTNANLYAQARRQPPYYLKTWSYHASVPANADKLTTEIIANPPAIIVWFTDLYESVALFFPELDAFISENYVAIEGVPFTQIPLQGRVQLLRYQPPAVTE